MRYIIEGRGGQGVFFLAKVVSQALMLTGIENFSFLKECDEGQRNGEIKITFNLPLTRPDKKLILAQHNMIALRKIVKDLNLNKNNVKKALQRVKPTAFRQNLNIWQPKTKPTKKSN